MIDSESLDRWITGNWGEDSVPDDDTIVVWECPSCGAENADDWDLALHRGVMCQFCKSEFSYSEV